MITAAAIRRQFPFPSPPASSITGRYCVGGAFLMALGQSNACFPYSEHVAAGLVAVNPCLDLESALLAARSIVVANDRGRVEEAWEYLDRALTASTLPVPMVVSAPAMVPEQDSEEALALV